MFSLSDLNTNTSISTSTEFIRINNPQTYNPQTIVSSDIEFTSRLFEHVPIMKNLILSEYNMVMSGKLVNELVIFADQTNFYKEPRPVIELFVNDIDTKQNIEKLRLYLHSYYSSFTVEPTKTHVSFITDDFILIVYYNYNNIIKLSVINELPCDSIIWNGISLLFNELTKNYLETNAIMYDMLLYSTKYYRQLATRFIKGISIIIKFDDFDEFLSNFKLNNMVEISTTTFTATGISNTRPLLIEYKFPTASAISKVDDTEFNIFTLQPKMSLLDTYHLLRFGVKGNNISSNSSNSYNSYNSSNSSNLINSTKNPLIQVLTTEELIQAELEIKEALNLITIKYATLIDQKLSL